MCEDTPNLLKYEVDKFKMKHDDGGKVKYLASYKSDAPDDEWYEESALLQYLGPDQFAARSFGL